MSLKDASPEAKTMSNFEPQAKDGSQQKATHQFAADLRDLQKHFKLDQCRLT